MLKEVKTNEMEENKKLSENNDNLKEKFNDLKEKYRKAEA